MYIWNGTLVSSSTKTLCSKENRNDVRNGIEKLALDRVHALAAADALFGGKKVIGARLWSGHRGPSSSRETLPLYR
jgi:hypothetical protein